jgi:hypothetical protein
MVCVHEALLFVGAYDNKQQQPTHTRARALTAAGSTGPGCTKETPQQQPPPPSPPPLAPQEGAPSPLAPAAQTRSAIRRQEQPKQPVRACVSAPVLLVVIRIRNESSSMVEIVN